MKLSRSKVGRSGLTNGARLWLSKVDGRSLEARRFADIIHEAEAERGGPEAMTLAQRSAVRAYAMLCVEREKIEVAQAQGREVNADDYGRLCDRMDRQVRRMGPVKAAARPTVRERYAEKRDKPA